MNRPWHEQHRLAKDASRSERVAWHAEHEVVCHCRASPAELAMEIAALRATEREASAAPENTPDAPG